MSQVQAESAPSEQQGNMGGGGAKQRLPQLPGNGNGKDQQTGPKEIPIAARLRVQNPYTPGPNAFFPQVTRHGSSKGPSFSLQGKFKIKE
ncbi:hypothetical protein HK102_007674, partial [Quaeritorhiza haematococci]